ncbi:putative salt tolerance-like protein [Platanthera guangdongensis]|uniref:Salt tolerance-like protein n=1 Tax=Platanthera guangdongensis TaxID=2320717 RepID=A0ABR2N3S7_9ASPA
MKIQCNACEAAEAKVLCCADEAALCLECDEKVHTANKLAGKHQRLPLLSGSSSSSSRLPTCDICQEFSGYFFCLEDRAILCRNCDVAVHTTNPCVSIHQRFLFTGVRVGLESTGSVPSVPKEQTSSTKDVPEPSPKQPKSSPLALSYTDDMHDFFSSIEVAKDRSMGGPLRTFFGGAPMDERIDEYPLEEFFRFSDFNQSYGFTDHGSSKADNGMLGSSEGSPMSRSFDEEVEDKECLGQVPEMPSLPTASGLHWPRTPQHHTSNNSAFVPDFSAAKDHVGFQTRRNLLKSRRSCHG